MSSDFKQTVNLKSKMPGAQTDDTKQYGSDENIPRKKAKPAPADKFFGHSKKAAGIDEVYKEAETQDFDYKKINRPAVKADNEAIYKKAVIFLSIALLGLIGYNLFFTNNENATSEENIVGEPAWCAVRLVNNEVYYGQVTDYTADPIILNNVYYDYDQSGENSEKKAESANLRLVKRGKETYGPSGSMYIIRSQTIYVEPLKEDSKVLKAILDYEQ